MDWMPCWPQPDARRHPGGYGSTERREKCCCAGAQILAVEDEALTRRLEAERRKMAEQIAEKDAKLQEELLKS